MFCKNCGNKLPDTVKFCPKCGSKVETATSLHGNDPVENNTEKNRQTQKQNGTKGIPVGLAVGLGLIFFIVCAAAGFFGFKIVSNMINEGTSTAQTDSDKGKKEKKQTKKDSEEKEDKEEKKETDDNEEDDNYSPADKLVSYAMNLDSIAGTSGTTYITSSQSSIETEADISKGNLGYYVDEASQILVTADYEGDYYNTVTLRTFMTGDDGEVEEKDSITFEAGRNEWYCDTGELAIFNWDINPKSDKQKDVVMHIGLERRELFCTAADGVDYLLKVYSIDEDGNIVDEYEESIAGSAVFYDEDVKQNIKPYFSESDYNESDFENSFNYGNLLYSMTDKAGLIGCFEYRSESYNLQQAGKYEQASDRSMRATAQKGSGVTDYPWGKVRVKGTENLSGSYDEFFDEEGYTSSSDEDSEYIIPDSDTRLLTEYDLYGFTTDELRIARNEIYARHGRKFTDKALQEYFDSKSWYYGVWEPDEFSDNMLSDIEHKNKDLIVEYEKKMSK